MKLQTKLLLKIVFSGPNGSFIGPDNDSKSTNKKGLTVALSELAHRSMKPKAWSTSPDSERINNTIQNGHFRRTFGQIPGTNIIYGYFH